MTNYNFIGIGIDRYGFLEPLIHAESDVHSLATFFLEDIGIAPERIFSLTNASASINQQPTYPTHKNIEYWLNQGLAEQATAPASATSVLWFLFSGYGLCYQQQDYLLPVDGQPQNPEETGISVQSLFEALQQQGAEKIIALMDIHSPPEPLGESMLGENTLALGQKMGIMTILSATPGEPSQADPALDNSFFMTGVLDALRYYRHDLTPTLFYDMLGDRLKELSEYHGLPVQSPVMVTPSHIAGETELILPSTIVRSTSATAAAKEAMTTTLESTVQDSLLPNETTGELGEINHPEVDTNLVGSSLPQHSSALLEDTEPLSDLGADQLADFSQAEFYTDDTLTEDEDPTAHVILPSRSDPTEHDSYLKKSGSIPGWQWLALLFVLVIGGLGWKFTLGRSPGDVNIAPRDPQLPATSSPPALENSPDQEGETAQQRQVLTAGNYVIGYSQASEFAAAISAAQAIQPDFPLYPEAQARIQRWSQVILDIAEARAIQGNLDGAIAAAELITADIPVAYRTAQDLIQQWQTLQLDGAANLEMIERAKALVRPDQAASYSRAIEAIQTIQSDEPAYDIAQTLQEQWSLQLYLIAQSHAEINQLEQAIQTATLIPETSSSYPLAEKAIARWQSGLR